MQEIIKNEYIILRYKNLEEECNMEKIEGAVIKEESQNKGMEIVSETILT